MTSGAKRLVGLPDRAAVAAAFLAAILVAVPALAAPADDCLIGAYRSPAGEPLVLTRSSTAPDALAYVLLDGENGRFEPTGPGEMVAKATPGDVSSVPGWLRHQGCDGKLRLRFGGGDELVWNKIALTETQTRFDSDGTELAGLLLDPSPGERTGIVAVMVHGSEATKSIGFTAYPYLLAAQGITAFVYDKRGAGDSQGTYTQSFPQLAGDAAAALREAKRMVGSGIRRAGFLGGSQGGWVAPLAALTARADFVAVMYGLIESPLGEDAEQVQDELRRKGYGTATLKKAREVTDATAAVVASHFSSGFDQLSAIKRRYASESWLSEIQGEYTGDLLRESSDALRRDGRARYDTLNIVWNYDARAVIEALPAPQLWVLAVQDTVAPSAHTAAEIRALQAKGRPIDLAQFPNTEHGIRLFVTSPEGERIRTRYAPGFLKLLDDWMKGQVSEPYGTAIIERAARHPAP